MTATKVNHARAMRYKRPALASIGYAFMADEIDAIGEACSEIQYFVEQDEETLLNALDGDEEAEYEFRLAFSDLSNKAEILNDVIRDSGVEEYFDDCTVALIGNRYATLGYDELEEDYFSLASYEQELAQTESGKKLMRRTKAEIISIIGQCLGIVIAYLDLRYSYDYLKATFNILRDENTSILRVVKDIESAYDAAYKIGFAPHEDASRQFNALLGYLPERIWLE